MGKWTVGQACAAYGMPKIQKKTYLSKILLVNNKNVTLDKVTYKDLYWHLINIQKT